MGLNPNKHKIATLISRVDKTAKETIITQELGIIPRTVERIVSAANLYRRIDGVDEPLIVPGIRHGCPTMRALVLALKGTVIKTPEISQGFLTNHHRYVDRAEGLSIATACGQVGPDKDWPYDELFSEDII